MARVRRDGVDGSETELVHQNFSTTGWSLQPDRVPSLVGKHESQVSRSSLLLVRHVVAVWSKGRFEHVAFPTVSRASPRPSLSFDHQESPQMAKPIVLV